MLLVFYLPFVLAIVLANYAEKHRVLKRVFFFLLGLANLLVAVVMGGYLLLAREPGLGGLSPFALEEAAGLRASFFFASLVALALLHPGVRRSLARLMNIVPNSTVHLLALTLAIYFVALTVPLATLTVEAQHLDTLPVSLSAWDLGLNAGMLLIIAAVGVGFPTRRSWRRMLTRLKLEPMTARQAFWAFLAILGLLAFDRIVVWLWAAYLPANYALVQEFNAQLFKDLMTPVGGVIVGITAGFGEEILFRGAVQPRFGLVLTSALFALAHLQYALSPALVEVLVVGLVLGLLRRRANTTTCILVHAGYNFADLLIIAAGNGL